MNGTPSSALSAMSWKNEGPYLDSLPQLRRAPTMPLALLLASMIAFSPQILTREALAMQANGSDAVVPFNNGNYEPFAAVYRKSTCQPILETITSQGSKRMRDLIESIDCTRFNAELMRKPGID